MTSSLPPGPFGAILADPPWDFEAWSGGGDRHPQRHYEVQDADAIAAIPVSAICAYDCALFLWATCPHLEEAFAVVDNPISGLVH